MTYWAWPSRVRGSGSPEGKRLLCVCPVYIGGIWRSTSGKLADAQSHTHVHTQTHYRRSPTADCWLVRSFVRSFARTREWESERALSLVRMLFFYVDNKERFTGLWCSVMLYAYSAMLFSPIVVQSLPLCMTVWTHNARSMKSGRAVHISGLASVYISLRFFSHVRTWTGCVNFELVYQLADWLTGNVRPHTQHKNDTLFLPVPPYGTGH